MHFRYKLAIFVKSMFWAIVVWGKGNQDVENHQREGEWEGHLAPKVFLTNMVGGSGNRGLVIH